jgi:hypothetical protein
MVSPASIAIQLIPRVSQAWAEPIRFHNDLPSARIPRVIL